MYGIIDDINKQDAKMHESVARLRIFVKARNYKAIYKEIKTIEELSGKMIMSATDLRKEIKAEVEEEE